MAKKKDIILTNKQNEYLYPLAHKDYNQHILDEYYFGIHGTLPANTDLNDIRQVGTHWLSSNTVYINAPWGNTASSSLYGMLKVYKRVYGSDVQIIQEVVKIGSSSANVYYRYLKSSGTSWDGWFESIATSGTVNSINFTITNYDGGTNNNLKIEVNS